MSDERLQITLEPEAKSPVAVAPEVEAAPEEAAPVEAPETPAAPEAPAAPEVKPEAEAKADEVVADEDIEPVEPVEPVVEAKRVSRFKKEDKLDEEALEKELEQAEALRTGTNIITTLYENDPEFRLHYLQALDRKGIMRPELRAELETLREKVGAKPKPETPAAPPAPKLNLEEIGKKALALRAANKDDEADALLIQAGADLALEKMKGELEPLKKADQARADEQRRREIEAARAAEAKTVETEVDALCKKYPKLVQRDPKTGNVKYLCKKFEAGFKEAYGRTPGSALVDIATVVLAKQGRLGKPRQAPPAKKTAPAAPPPHAKADPKAKAPDAEFSEDGRLIIRM